MSYFGNILLNLIIVLILLYLLLVVLGLVLLSVLDDAFGDRLDCHGRVQVEFLIDAHLLGDLVGVDVLVLLQHLVLIGSRMHHLRYVQALDHIFGDLVV